MSVRVIPLQLNLVKTESHMDAGGSYLRDQRLPEEEIASDLEEQLQKADVPVGSQLVAVIPSSKRGDKYLALYNCPDDVVTLKVLQDQGCVVVAEEE